MVKYVHLVSSRSFQHYHRIDSSAEIFGMRLTLLTEIDGIQNFFSIEEEKFNFAEVG